MASTVAFFVPTPIVPMARMRWMYEEASGRWMAVCLYCDTAVAADPMRNFYCFCRSKGAESRVVAHDLGKPELRGAA